jgi:5-dehydro-4-deoxyglucarate dehydratase
MFDGVLFFPVTPFGADGELNVVALAEHVEQRMESGPGGVFAACGTGEFHALSGEEYAASVRRTVDVVAGRVPVFAGAGGALPAAKECARAADDAGADGLLLLPPYLVSAPQAGLVAYARAVAETTRLPIIVYSRGNAVLDVASSVELAQLPNIIGFKDGVGDLGAMSQIITAVRGALAGTGKTFSFFNGLPTAEVTVPAYRSVGVDLYSSAVFCFAPEIALAFYAAVTGGDTDVVQRLLAGFYHPLVTLRDKVPGYAVALVKAGVRLRGLDAGGVRPPLVDPSPDHLQALGQILDDGLAIVEASR